MATVKETAQPSKPQESEVNTGEVLAKATKFYQKWEGVGKTIDNFIAEFRGLRSEIVHLLNSKESMDRLVKEAEIRLSQADREAQTRLSSVEQGHRTLVDKLSKREIELSAKLSEMEKREIAVAAERNRYELLKDEYERKLASLIKVEPVISKR